MLPSVHFKLTSQILQPAPVFCILKNKIIMYSSLKFIEVLLLSHHPNHHLCSRRKTYCLSIPFIQKPIHLCNPLCHPPQQLSLLHTLSERPQPDLHIVFATWGNGRFSQLKLWVLFPILCLILSNTTSGFLTAAH